MKTFYFTVRGDRITEKEDYIFIEGNKGSYEAVFDFGEEWDELAKLCIVENGKTVYKPRAIIGNSCLLPEFIRGSVKIGVIGVDSLDGAELVTRISTNMIGIGVQNGAASKEANAELSKAAEVWEQYLIEMENNRKAAEAAQEAAETAQQGALSSEGYAKVYAEEARVAKDRAETVLKNTEDCESRAHASAVNAENWGMTAIESSETAQKAASETEDCKSDALGYADAAYVSALNAKASADNAQEAEGRIGNIVTDSENRLEILKSDIKANLSEAQASANHALEAAEEAKDYAQSAKGCETEAGGYAGNALLAMQNAEESEKTASQALSDLLAMINSGDLVLATDGKLPLSSIPATATQEIYTVSSEDELTSLTAQRGDLAELIEIVNGEKTITKTWQCLGEASVRENWVVWGTSYAVQSGNSTTADNATNANMINNHRLVEMTEEEFAAAVKDADTYYLVY